MLASHSWGGILVQLLAFRRPGLVAGLVLVDPGHEEMESGLTRPLQLGMRVWRAAFRDELRDDVPATIATTRRDPRPAQRVPSARQVLGRGQRSTEFRASPGRR